MKIENLINLENKKLFNFLALVGIFRTYYLMVFWKR